MGAHAGNYFYILDHNDPQSIYADLAALSIQLQVISVPVSQYQLLPELFVKYPPRFIYLQGNALPEVVQHKAENAQFITDDKFHFKQCLSFREIFNMGIFNERKYFTTFNQLRSHILPQTIVAPVYFDAMGNLHHEMITHEAILNMQALLARKIQLRKKQSLLFDVDLSSIHQKFIAIYWPILSGMKCIFAAPQFQLAKNLRLNHPTLLLTHQAPASFMELLISKKFNGLLQRIAKLRNMLRKLLYTPLHTVIALQNIEESERVHLLNHGIHYYVLSELLYDTSSTHL